MYLIEAKRTLAENDNASVLATPEADRNTNRGQCIVLRVDAEGERVPFTICDINRTLGTVTILVQTVGATTAKLAELGAGDYIADFVGPLGNPTDLAGYGKAMLVGGGIGGAVIYPQAKYLASIGKPATVVLGARNESLLMYEREMGNFASDLHIMTDDGSKGGKGFVTDKVRELLGKEKYDVVMAVGPLMMMKAVCDVTREFGVHTIVSMNSVMVDGTGMCGCCRVTVGGERKYACVDGPEFDGHLVDFDEARLRAGFYKEQEAEHMCRIRGGKK